MAHPLLLRLREAVHDSTDRKHLGDFRYEHSTFWFRVCCAFPRDTDLVAEK